jgi:hypothetical protein
MVAEDTKEVENDDIDIEVNGGIKKGSELYIFPVTKQTLLFQVILMLGCCHYSMIMTNWGSPVIDGSVSDFFKASDFSFYVKIVI